MNARRPERTPARLRAMGLAATLLFSVAPGGLATGTEVPAGPRTLRADVRFLSAPELEGRGALTAGLVRAADYLAVRFRAAGLRPAGDRGTFFQGVEIPLPRRPTTATRLEIAGAPLRLGVDFVPNTGAAARRGVAPLAFGGRCAAPELAAIDGRGKALVCFQGGAPLAAKMELAIARGALALLIVDPDDALADEDGATGAAPLRPLAIPGGAKPVAIASFHVRAGALAPLFAWRGTSLRALRTALERRADPLSFDLPGWATFELGWSHPIVAGRNVVGLLEGRDPTLAGEAVLVGAHYDHLGHGDEGSVFDAQALHPGADDNASGIAALLEAAQQLSAAPVPPRRSVLFVAFTGEEKGLVGSTAVAAHAPRRVVAMLNLDMVGRMRDDVVEVGGLSTSPDWRAIVEGANLDRLALRFPVRLVPNSDHAPFVRRGIPSLFFFTGMHGDYHRTTDTWDKVNYDGLDKIGRLAGRVVRAAADRPAALSFAPPSWTSGAAPAGGAP